MSKHRLEIRFWKFIPLFIVIIDCWVLLHPLDVCLDLFALTVIFCLVNLALWEQDQFQ